MPIKIFSDRIELGDKVITATPTGIRIDDSLSANTQNTRLGSTNFTARQLAYGNFVFQGSVAGYTAGSGPSPAPLNTINRFPFTADTSATDHGDLTVTSAANAGQSSSTDGYSSGSYGGGGNLIRKYPFASTSGSISYGGLSSSRGLTGSEGQSSSIHGYVAGGSPPFPPGSNVIDKFPFSTNSSATDVGDLTQGRYNPTGQSSTISGYSSGGYTPSRTTSINKFPFATDTNATSVGSLSEARSGGAGQSSTNNGYTSGGGNPSGDPVNTILKFPFASDTNTTDVGDLTVARSSLIGQSSTTHGYANDGVISPPTISNTIDKFSFSTDANATDVGDLAVNMFQGAGAQY